MNTLDTLLQSEDEKLIQRLKKINILDIGIITGFAQSTGRAEITTFDIQAGQRHVITDAEVLYPGSANNGLTGSIIGAPCLIFWPRTIVPSLRDRKIMTRATAYSSAGAKCIPLSTGARATNLRVGFTGTGDFGITTKDYSIVVTDQEVHFTTADHHTQYSLSKDGLDSTLGGGKINSVTKDDGTVEVYYTNSSGKVSYRMLWTPDGIYKIQRNAKEAWDETALADHESYVDYTWETVYADDGTITETLNDGGDSTKPLWVSTRKPDGSVQLTQTNADGEVLNDVTITADGDITIGQTKANNTVTLKQDGTCTVTTKADTSINAGGNVNIIAGDGKKLKAGNNSTTLKTILVEDLLTLLSAFDSVGSPGSTTTGPNATAKITEFKTKWAQVLD